jgi:hypothetical protein
MISYNMETFETIGWISLGFIPTYAGLEVGSRKLTRRKTPKLLLNVRDEK